MLNRLKTWCLLLALCLTAWHPLFAKKRFAQYSKRHPHSLSTAQPTQSRSARRELSAFSQVRSEVINMISGAGKRVWLVSNYLTDGDIVSALYIAKYRKVSVSVLLSPRYANAYMSRLKFLKSQNIPVFLLPKSWRFPEPTAILADERLVSIDGSLDFMKPKAKYTLKEHKGESKMLFIRSFQQAIGQKVPAVPSPRFRIKSKSPNIAEKTKSKPTYSGENDGSFNYNRVKHPRRAPRGVPRRLPSKTILQNKRTNKLKE